MTAEVHANGETGQQRHSKIISSIQLCPEHPHFPSPPLEQEWKARLSEMKNVPGVFSGLVDHQRHFRTVAALGWSIAQIGSTNLPRTIPGRETLEQLLCHQQSASDFSFRYFSQSKTQSRNHLMTQSQTETALVQISCGITPDPARQKWRRQRGFHRLGLAKLIKSNHFKEKNEKKQMKPF